MKRNVASKIALLSVLFFVSLPPLSAKKKKAAAETAPAKEKTGTSIPVPDSVRQQKQYFDSISPRVMALVEDGSPRSLKTAASLLHHANSSAYSEKEKVLLVVCTNIMELAWPSVPVTWQSPRLSSSDPYTGAIYSASNGIFDKNPKNSDFLSFVLPAFVILTEKPSAEARSKAEESLKKALSMRADSTLVNYLLGKSCLDTRQYKAAARYLAQAAKSETEGKEVLLACMEANSGIHAYDAVLDAGARLLNLYPQEVHCLELCCDAYFAQGNMDKAGEYAAKILMLTPENFAYVLMRAKIAAAGEDYVKASSLLDAYSRSGNRSKDYYLLRAKLQKDWNKNAGSAAETMGKALLDYPADTDILLFAAKVASDGNMGVAGASALELARKVLVKDSHNREAVKICITELGKNGDYEAAYRLSSKAIKDSILAEDIYYTHIDVCLALRKYDEAWKLSHDLYTRNKGLAEAQKAYLKVLVATGRTGDAEKMIASLMATADSQMKSFLYYEQSFLYGDESSMLENLRSSLTLNPRNSEALYRLYQVYYNKKDWRRAQYYLRQVVALNPVDGKALAKNKELDALLQK